MRTKNDLLFLAIGVFLRFFLAYAFPNVLCENLSNNRFEFSTAFDAFNHAKEFAHLQNTYHPQNSNNNFIAGGDDTDGFGTGEKRITSSSRVSPFVGAVFAPFCGDGSKSDSVLWSVVPFVCVDVLTAIVLSQIYERGCAKRKNEKTAEDDENKGEPTSIVGVYMLHPIIILSCLSRTTKVVQFLLTSLVVYAAIDVKTNKRSPTVTGGALAMLSLVHLPSAVTLLPGVLLHFWSVRENAFGTSGKKLAVHFLSQYACALGTFVNVADKYVVPNDELKEWLRVSIFDRYRAEELQPNVGLHWYVYSLMWERFLPWYCFAFQGCGIVCALTITARFVRSQSPLFSACAGLLCATALASHPTLGEFAFTTVLILAHGTSVRVLERSEAIKIVADGTMIALAIFGLSFVTLRAWLITRTGNPNYFFAVTLMYAVGQVYVTYETLTFALSKKKNGKASTKAE